MTTLSLMSPYFLALSLGSALLLAVLRGPARHAVFLAANVAFLAVLLLGVRGTASTIAFCLLGYALVRVALWQPRGGLASGLAAYVGLFAYMRNYDFLGWLLPAGALAPTLTTVGLSFLFFKVVHVMIEARSGTLGHLHFLTYLNYCLNFTTFMMGPLQRYQDFDGQFNGSGPTVPLTFEAHLDALLRILQGFLKAYVLAAWLAPYALAPDADLFGMAFADLLVGIYAFYFFLYLSFAGYCDVVIGVGSLLGVQPPENFDKPFLARDISEFWSRFHRSLTLWLTNYVFSPTYKWALTRGAFASRPLLATNAALLVTMLVSGLWHGTTPSFLLFGLAHGLYFVVFRTWEALAGRWLGKRRFRAWRTTWVAQGAALLVTFNAVAFSLIFFRLDSGQVLKALATLGGAP